MCFAPQRVCTCSTSEPPKVVRTLRCLFLAFWLRNVLRATTACTFSTSEPPKVVRTLVCFVHFDFEICFAPQRRALFRHLQLPKVLRDPWCVLYILTWKCASRHNGVHFFNISTSKSAPRTKVFSAFSLQNLLRATMACTFSTSQLPKVVRE